MNTYIIHQHHYIKPLVVIAKNILEAIEIFKELSPERKVSPITKIEVYDEPLR